MNDFRPDASIPYAGAPDPGMSPTVQARLLALNRQFYQTVGSEFDRTRQGLPLGMVDLAGRLAVRHAGRQMGRQAEHGAGRAGEPLALLDVGCGNGRLARALAGAGLACTYTGLDADAQLLAFAQEQTAGLPQVSTTFVQADIAQAGWSALLGAQTDRERSASPSAPPVWHTKTGGADGDVCAPRRASCDVVACLAVLHHFPGLRLRARIVQELASLLAPEGVLALSTWQFLSSERLAHKQAEWAAVGVDAAEIEPGDALLPWNQGAHALRYVHQLDLPELEQLAAAAGLRLMDAFRADGKEGNLNLYTLWVSG